MRTRIKKCLPSCDNAINRLFAALSFTPGDLSKFFRAENRLKNMRTSFLHPRFVRAQCVRCGRGGGVTWMLDWVGERALIRLFCLGVHSPAHYQAYCPSHCYPYPDVSLFCNFPHLTDTTASPSTPIHHPHFPCYSQPLRLAFPRYLLASSFPHYRVLTSSHRMKETFQYLLICHTGLSYG